MNLSDQTYLIIGAVIALPIAIVVMLNWLLRNRGGFARGWAGAVFVGLCWTVAMAIIVTRTIG